ncbi:MAG TPA: hypothetical protein PKN87_09330 [Syntrophomonadaceae bacterium]|nr:hypothetical protein [Syntrophomonadaceae bacterium]HNX29590.1 hypothetical protein [Syntrophomonadaceae bacterium]HPR94061.1 hypothetical protein [Syntrophomonadaceae bacterium]
MNFYTPMALLLLVIGCLCLLAAIPQMVKSIEKTLTKAEMPLPSRKVLFSGIAVQNLFMLMIAAAIGTLLAPAADLQAPVLKAILTGGSVWQGIKPQLLPGVVAGLVSALAFIPAYYTFFLQHLDFQTLWAVENHRLNLNLVGRLLYNGIFEEIIVRWGLMTLFVWLGSLFSGEISALIVWLAIFISGAALALLYLPDYYAAGCLKSRPFFAFIAFLYIWNAAVFGWLFWQYGFEAAIIAHMIFLLIWYLYDMRLNIAKKIEALN